MNIEKIPLPIRIILAVALIAGLNSKPGSIRINNPNSTIQNKLVNEVAGYIDRITIPSRIETMRLLLENRQQQSFLELHLNIVNMIEGRKSESIVAVINDHYRYWRQIGSMNKDFENDIQKEK